MAGISEMPRPSSRSYSDSHAQQTSRPCLPARGLLKTSRAPPAALRSLSPALQVIQKSLLPEAQRVPDAPRGNRPRDYLSLIQGCQQTLAGDRKRSPSPEVVARDSTVAASLIDIPSSNGASFRSSLRPKTPDHRGDMGKDHFRKAPLSARMRRTSSENACQTPQAPLSARADYARPFSAIPLRTPDDSLGCAGTLWPTDRSRRGGVAEELTSFRGRPKSAAASNHDGFDALDALLTSVLNDGPSSDAPRTITTSASPRTKPGAELKCGIAPVLGSESKAAAVPIRPQASTPVVSSKYDEFVEAASPNLVEVDDSRPSVYCSMSATLMSVHLPGSPIAKAVEFDDSDVSVVLLSDPLPSSKPQSRGQKVRFECHGPRKVPLVPQAPQAPTAPLCQTSIPQAPRRKGTTSRPLGCTVVAFGGA